jgi:hypothetical protein
MHLRDGSLLTPIERELVGCVVRGDVLNLGPDAWLDKGSPQWREDDAIRAQVIREIILGYLVTDLDPKGVRIQDAKIFGKLDLENVSSRVPIELSRCFIDAGITLRDSRLPVLAFDGCRIEAPTGSIALDGNRLHTDSLSLYRATIRGSSPRGVLTLRGAVIAGPLSCSNMHVENDQGVAIDLESLTVDHDLVLRESNILAEAERGAIAALGTRIKGQWDCSGVSIVNTSGSCIVAEAARIDQSFFMRRGFNARSSAAPRGAIVLARAHVGGQVSFNGAELINSDGPAINADRMTASAGLFMDNITAQSGAGPAFDLMSVETGDFVFTPRKVNEGGNARRWFNLDGFKYSGIPDVPAGVSWLNIIQTRTPYYSPQPYQYLASAYRASGHEEVARYALIRQRRDYLHRGHVRFWHGLWVRFTGITLGFGYQPWRALGFLAAILCLAVILAVNFGSAGALVHTSNSSLPGAPCTVAEQVRVGLDLGLPIIRTGIRSHCDLAPTHAGQYFALIGWAIQLLSWGFATLFVVGFTGAVRKI